jgi:hypothetical protein
MTRVVRLLVFFIFICSVEAWARPNLIFKDSEAGFSLKTEIKDWQLLSQSNSDKVFVVKKPSGTGQMITAMSLRRDHSRYKSAKAYAEHWLLDYPKFGFELVFARARNIGPVNGYEMQLKAPQADKIVHQLVVQRQNEMLVFTCSDQTDRFKETFEGCQKVFSSLKF